MRIAVTGPECTGKSQLSRDLSLYLKLPLVEEYAREYLSDLGTNYQLNDLVKIALEQARRNVNADSGEGVVCDTEMVVLKIWSLDKFSTCPPEIQHYLNAQSFDLYLLTYPDLEWQKDSLRESPSLDHRLQLFDRYHGELDQLGRPFRIIRGRGNARLENALSCVREMS